MWIAEASEEAIVGTSLPILKMTNSSSDSWELEELYRKQTVRHLGKSCRSLSNNQACLLIFSDPAKLIYYFFQSIIISSGSRETFPQIPENVDNQIQLLVVA